jgi:hypothetical protein
MIWVTHAKYAGEYRIRLRFSDGLEGEIDLRETLFGDRREIFAELTNLEAFRRFRIAMDTVVWDNGLDLAPEFLRALLQPPRDDRDRPAAG